LREKGEILLSPFLQYFFDFMSYKLSDEKDQMSIGPSNRILVNANEAAKLLSISKSQFFLKVRAGVLPPPTRGLGRPLWAVSRLRQAVEGLPNTQGTAEKGPIDWG
jgi:hypothetical protein